MKSHEVSCVGGKTHNFLVSDAIIMNGSVFCASNKSLVNLIVLRISLQRSSTNYVRARLP
jgi:hypothetical protein